MYHISGFCSVCWRIIWRHLVLDLGIGSLEGCPKSKARLPPNEYSEAVPTTWCAKHKVARLVALACTCLKQKKSHPGRD
jgi:hypothetical protein